MCWNAEKLTAAQALLTAVLASQGADPSAISVLPDDNELGASGVSRMRALDVLQTLIAAASKAYFVFYDFSHFHAISEFQVCSKISGLTPEDLQKILIRADRRSADLR